MFDLEKVVAISYDDLQQWIEDNALPGGVEDTKDVLIYMGYFWFHVLKNGRTDLTLDILDQTLFGETDIDSVAPHKLDISKLS